MPGLEEGHGRLQAFGGAHVDARRWRDEHGADLDEAHVDGAADEYAGDDGEDVANGR